MVNSLQMPILATFSPSQEGRGKNEEFELERFDAREHQIYYEGENLLGKKSQKKDDDFMMDSQNNPSGFSTDDYLKSFFGDDMCKEYGIVDTKEEKKTEDDTQEEETMMRTKNGADSEEEDESDLFIFVTNPLTKNSGDKKQLKDIGPQDSQSIPIHEPKLMEISYKKETVSTKDGSDEVDREGAQYIGNVLGEDDFYKNLDQFVSTKYDVLQMNPPFVNNYILA